MPLTIRQASSFFFTTSSLQDGERGTEVLFDPVAAHRVDQQHVPAVAVALDRLRDPHLAVPAIGLEGAGGGVEEGVSHLLVVRLTTQRAVGLVVAAHVPVLGLSAAVEGDVAVPLGHQLPDGLVQWTDGSTVLPRVTLLFSNAGSTTHVSLTHFLHWTYAVCSQ